MSFAIGANASSQFICFLLCLAFGCGGGVFGLLYFRKANFFERILTDFFATVCMGGAFIGAVEVAMQGQIRFYGIIGYLSGVAIVLFFCKLLHRQKINKNGRKSKKE